MQSLRQIGTGVLLGVISVVIVLGGLTLALVEGGMSPIAVSTDLPAENTPSGESATIFPTLPLLIFTDTPQGPVATSTASLTPPPTLTNCPLPAGWVSIVTQPYDTLNSLAQVYRTTIDQLRVKNCLLNDKIIPNSILYVPAQPTATFMPCGAPVNWGYYTVIAGDTLYRVSLLYRVTVAALMQANCLTTSVIRAGQTLRVPNVPTSTAPPVSITNTSTATPTLTLSASPTGTMSEGTTGTPPISATPTGSATGTASPTSTETPTLSVTETPPAAAEVPSPTMAPSEMPLPSATPTPGS